MNDASSRDAICLGLCDWVGCIRGSVGRLPIGQLGRDSPSVFKEDEHGGKCLGWKADLRILMHRTGRRLINGETLMRWSSICMSDEDVYYTMAENSLELTSSGRCDVEETVCIDVIGGVDGLESSGGSCPVAVA